MQNFVAIGWKMPEISAIENLCSAKKWAKVHQNFLGDAIPKTSHHAKFHRDWSNQLGDRGWSEKNFHTQTHWHTRHPDWLSRVSQHARGTTKNTIQHRIITRANLFNLFGSHQMVIGAGFDNNFVARFWLEFLLKCTGCPHPDLGTYWMRYALIYHLTQLLGMWKSTFNLPITCTYTGHV